MSSYDAVDRALLAELATDPRATVVALADRLGLSRNTVQARMSRLETSGAFLSFERSIDPAPLGFPLEAFISVHVRQKQLAEVVDEIAEIPEVIQAHGLSGSVDLLVRVVCRDAHDLFRIDGEILAIEGVERTETSLAMGELIPYRLGPLLERKG
jgi:DNA-binding Lrp family transcriptional regulator